MSAGYTGRQALDAYNNGGDPATRNKDWRGNPVPSWDELPENVRAKWEAVARDATLTLTGKSEGIVE